MKTDPVIVIAGSRALPSGIAPRLLVRFLATIPEGSKVLLRRGILRDPGEFEQQVAKMCDLLGLTVEWRRPESTEFGSSVGRKQTFARDMTMIYDSDLILCFHTPEQIGDASSGTASLVEKALQAEKVVYAYAIEGEDMVRVGEHDEENEWGEMLLAAWP